MIGQSVLNPHNQQQHVGQSEVERLGLLSHGIAAFRANLPAAIGVWCVAVVVVGGYYVLDPITLAMQRLAQVKQEVGLPYAIVSTAVFCGLIPFGLQVLQRGQRRNFAWPYLVFLVVFWAYKGVEVELLYRLQAVMFGHDPTLRTVLLKLLFDQCVYVPILAVPGMVLALAWASGGYRLARLRAAMAHGGGRWYRRMVLPVLIPNVIVWVPAVLLIYLLPTPLQLPLQNLVACIWATMLMFMTHHRSQLVAGETAMVADS